MGFDDITEALGGRARRQVLVELQDHNPVDQPEAVTKNSAQEDEVQELQLTHTHLPKLDDMGYIVWDRDHGTIIKGPNWEEIEPVVRLLSDNRDQIPNDTF
ncbi:hypothetical protein EA462_15465 [Natrarchaeobius halalkaliphilus]|uniref:DUF7344 domain-containing protein n=1 Tax=Natrarchaeobius halalkaliphilus TaxID=1679091 RepID=A0A3N6M4F2_9EURY|nr:hypothetical protein [Natrarchaeobius halalkaliphilus]RQG87037.1 hypothetical protein EA462_15465 [Natrarchaeobius halalkaliphilus]